MTNLPNPDNNINEANLSEKPQKPLHKRKKLWLGLLLFTLVGLGGSVTFAWYFVQRQLTPIVQQNLTKFLNRPINLGEVSGFSPFKITFGKSQLPPTAQDTDQVLAEAVDVNFNPFALVFQRTLDLKITIIKPDIYIEQDQNGVWIATEITPQESPLLKVKVREINTKNAVLTVVSRTAEGKLQAPVNAQINWANSSFLNNNQLVQYSLEGKVSNQGKINLEGKSLIPSGVTNLTVSVKKVNLTDIDLLLPLPLTLHGGQSEGMIEIGWQPGELPLIKGKVQLENANVSLPQLPKPLTQTQGQLIFNGTAIQFDQLTTNLGVIAAEINGTFDQNQGLGIKIETKPVSIPQVLNTFAPKQKLPIQLTGELKAQVQILGTIQKPVVQVMALATKPLQLGKLNLKTAKTSFTIKDSAILIQDIQALPTVGGNIQGKGKIELANLPNQKPTNSASVPLPPPNKTENKPNQNNSKAVLEIQANNLPGIALAAIYGNRLPLPVGRVSAKAKVLIPLSKPTDFSALGSANLTIGKGTLSTQNFQITKGLWQGTFTANNIQIHHLLIGQVFNNIPVAVRQGSLNGSVELSGDLKTPKLSSIQGQGNANLRTNKGEFRIRNLRLQSGKWQASVDVDNFDFASIYPQYKLPTDSLISGNFNLLGDLENFNLNTVAVSGNARLGLAGGVVTASNIGLNQGNYQASLSIIGIQPQQIFSQLSPTLESPISGLVNLSGNINNLGLKGLNAEGSAVVAGGNLQVSNFLIKEGQWQTNLIARNVDLKRLLPQLPDTFEKIVNSNIYLQGNLEDLSLANLQGQGQGQLRVSGGNLTVSNFSLQPGKLTANLDAQGINLQPFNEQLRGKLTGDFQLTTTSLTAVNLNQIKAAGNLTFSEGLGLLTDSLNTRVVWNGQRLEIQEAIAPNLKLQGWVAINTTFPLSLNSIKDFNLTVDAQQINLATLDLSNNRLNYQPQLNGQLNFLGTIAGTIQQPDLKGQLSLDNFAIETIAFAPRLEGNISSSKEAGIQLQLEGEDNQIQVALDPNYQPRSLLVQLGQQKIIGSRSQDILNLETQNLDLALITNLVKNVNPNLTQNSDLDSQEFQGQLSANLNLDLTRLEGTGKLQINNLVLGRLQGEQIDADLHYSPQLVTISNGQFNKGKGQYLFNASFRPQFANFDLNNLDLKAAVKVVEGEVQDVLYTLQIFEFDDFARGLKAPVYAKSAELYTSENSGQSLFSVGNPQANLRDQLRRFSEIKNLLAIQQQKRKDASLLPELSELTGKFSGDLIITSSQQEGLQAEFDFRGGKSLNSLNPELSATDHQTNNWQWGVLKAENIILKGNYDNGILTLLPFAISLDQAQIRFSGTFGSENLGGQLELSNVPVELLRQVAELPSVIGFNGLINGNATLGGTKDNPQLIGAIRVIDATIQQTPIQSTLASFNYNNARLEFSGSSVLAEATDPITISGSIPYPLSFAKVKPDNDELQLSFNLKNQGITLLNILTNEQIKWIDGEGEVDLLISGKYDPNSKEKQPLIAQGIATVNQGTIGLQILPDAPLTEVNGKILFNFDRIAVEALSGKFSGGQINVTGNLPLDQPNLETQGLNVVFNQLALNLKGLYEGGVEGNVKVLGTAIEPSLEGEINLFNGQIELTEKTETNTSPEDGLMSVLTLNNLQLNLKDNVQVVRLPILNFLASGQLIVNGNLLSLNPQGTIRLNRGLVNLFTTQFTLAGGYENIAKFTPENGLDPYLDLRLVTSVLETNRNPTVTDPLSSEVSESLLDNFDSVNTIRVLARVDGLASQLTDSLELTSTPVRSKTEIAALLGGGFVNTLGRGDTTLGLANLAGSALLNPIQQAIGKALGLSEFRLFTTAIVNDDNEEKQGKQTSTLGLAAEASVDINRQFSISALKILTNDDPPQLGLRYRINDQLLLRGTSDFTEDSRFMIEYENRF